MIPINFMKLIHDKALAAQPSAKTKAKLLDILFNTQKRIYTRDELVQLIYKLEDFNDRTTRQKQAIYMTLRKLMQRTRSLLNSVDQSKEWLFYDRKLDAWILYKDHEKKLEESKNNK